MDKRRDAADELVWEWWRYARGYFPNIWYPSLSPYCRESKSSRQWETTDEIADEARARSLLASIELAVNELDPESRRAVMVEMRCRYAGAKVWRPLEEPTVSYWDALTGLIPLLEKHQVVLIAAGSD